MNWCIYDFVQQMQDDFVQQMQEQLTQELQQMGDKFVNVQKGFVWDNDDRKFEWTDAKLQERFQLLSRQCNGDEGLFNRVDRFLMQNASKKWREKNPDRLDSCPNNPYAYAARCNDLRNMIRISLFTDNQYCVCVL